MIRLHVFEKRLTFGAIPRRHGLVSKIAPLTEQGNFAVSLWTGNSDLFAAGPAVKLDTFKPARVRVGQLGRVCYKH